MTRRDLAIRRGASNRYSRRSRTAASEGKGLHRLKLIGDSPADWVTSLAALHLTAARVTHETGAYADTYAAAEHLGYLASATTTSRSPTRRSTRPAVPPRPIRRPAQSRRARCASPRRTARTGWSVPAEPPARPPRSRGGRASLCQLARWTSRTVEPPSWANPRRNRRDFPDRAQAPLKPQQSPGLPRPPLPGPDPGSSL